MFNLLKLNVFCFLNYLVAGRVEQFFTSNQRGHEPFDCQFCKFAMNFILKSEDFGVSLM